MPINPSVSMLISGASALLVPFPTQQPLLQPVNTCSDIENMKNDVCRIGGDFISAGKIQQLPQIEVAL